MASAPPQFQEGQRVRGRNGEIAVIRNGVPVVEGSGMPSPISIGGVDPRRPIQTEREAVGLQGDRYNTSDAPVEDRFTRENALRTQFNALPEVRRYSEIVPVYISARDAEDNRAGDLNLIYAFGKIMDPGSVVREAELNMVQGTSPIAERLRAIIGSELEGTGRLSPATRRNLLSELRSRRLELAQAYATARNNYIENARGFGIDPDRVVGEHPAQVYADQERAAREAAGGQGPVAGEELPAARLTAEQERLYDAFLTANPNATPDQLRTFAQGVGIGRVENAEDVIAARREGAGVRPASEALLRVPDETVGGQSASGAYEGLAGILGAPVDLTTSGLNAFGAGIERPFGGSERWRSGFLGAGLIDPESSDPSLRIARRVGESVGASALPTAASATTLPRMLAGLGVASGGGAGAATAERIFPGNPWAEIGGELAGSAAAGGGAFGLASNQARRTAEAAVPTTNQLRAQASGLYDAAESRGVVGGPNVTANMAGRVKDIARQAEVLDSPMYPHAGEAVRVTGGHAGQSINPTQIQVIREGLADAVHSTEGRQRNIAREMLRAFDEETVPLAPELSEARQTASRYLQADQIDLARTNADTRSTQFSRSGDDNSLRTDFRGLERRINRGDANFPEGVEEAIKRVVRGGPARNVARWFGGLAPSTQGGNLVPGLSLGGAGGLLAGDPVIGALIAGGTMALGTGGRAAAGSLARRDADVAHLLARAGGEILVGPVVNDELRRQIALSLAAQIYGDGETVE